jgi:hypothetical protein
MPSWGGVFLVGKRGFVGVNVEGAVDVFSN